MSLDYISYFACFVYVMRCDQQIIGFKGPVKGLIKRSENVDVTRVKFSLDCRTNSFFSLHFLSTNALNKLLRWTISHLLSVAICNPTSKNKPTNSNYFQTT